MGYVIRRLSALILALLLSACVARLPAPVAGVTQADNYQPTPGNVAVTAGTGPMPPQGARAVSDTAAKSNDPLVSAALAAPPAMPAPAPAMAAVPVAVTDKRLPALAVPKPVTVPIASPKAVNKESPPPVETAEVVTSEPVLAQTAVDKTPNEVIAVPEPLPAAIPSAAKALAAVASPVPDHQPAAVVAEVAVKPVLPLVAAPEPATAATPDTTATDAMTIGVATQTVADAAPPPARVERVALAQGVLIKQPTGPREVELSADEAFVRGAAAAAGRGTVRDNASAMRWYRFAAARGSAAAENNIGFMYAEGRGVRRDDAEAVRWYARAADRNYPPALTGLGMMYALGRGVPQSDADAIALYSAAANQGYGQAKANLAEMYGMGRGVPRDATMAMFLLGSVRERPYTGSGVYVEPVLDSRVSQGP